MERKQSLDAFLQTMLTEMDYHVREFGITGDEDTGNETTAWNSADQSFTGLTFKAQTFVEYNGCDWVEVCSSRKFSLDGESPEEHIPVRDRQDSEKYRVLDDDCGSFRNSWAAEYSKPQARMNKKRKLNRLAAESRNSQWANER
jgi:hypothetical protein